MSKFNLTKLLRFGSVLRGFYVRKDISVTAKLIVGMAILYIVSPIDFLPDFYPFVGWIEDIIIGVLTVGFVKKSVREEPKEDFRKEDAITVDAKVIEEE